jgi:ABC-type multidrug transport system fused ATPase/permease subunit
MRVTLSESAWHARLQEWVFGDVTLRRNLCPYFWLTVFCMVVAPIVGFARGSWKCLVFLFSVLDRVMTPVVNLTLRAFDAIATPIAAGISKLIRYRRESKLNNETNELGLDGAYRIWKQINEFQRSMSYGNPMRNTRFREHCEKLLARFKQLNPGWEGLFTQHEAELEERVRQWKELQRKLEQEKLERERARERMMNNIALWTKWFFIGVWWAIAGVVVTAAASVVCLLLWLFVTNFMVIPWKVVGWIALGVVVIAVVLAFLVDLVRSMIERAKHAEREEKPAKEPKGPGLFSLYYKAAKENYCPGVDWVE